MHITKKPRIISVMLSLLAVFSLVPAESAFAAGNTIYVTPNTLSVQPGNTFTVQVKGFIDGPAWPMGGEKDVYGALTFPTNLLRATSVSTAGASFTWSASATINNTNGTVNFSESNILEIAGNVHIMSVTFQALANGSANVGFTSGTRYDNNRGTTSGGTYTISTPPPATCPAGQTGTPPNCTTPPPPPPATCPAGQTGTPPNCTTPPPPTNPSPSNPKPNQPSSSNPSTAPVSPLAPSAPTVSPNISTDTTPDNGFSITEVTATRSYNKATLNWQTTNASKATVSYGTSLSKLDKSVEATQLPDLSYDAALTELTPGKQYYYKIIATSDSDATKTDEYSGVFTTRAFPVMITITENKKPAPNAKVKIGEQNYSTDKSGKITLELASGSYTGEAKTQGGTKKFTLVVAKKTIPGSGRSPEIQRFSYDIPISVAVSQQNNDLLMVIIGLIVGGSLLAMILFWLWRRRKNQDEEQQSMTYASVDNSYTWAPQAAPLPTPPPITYPEQPVAFVNEQTEFGQIDMQPPIEQYGAMPAAQSDIPYTTQVDTGIAPAMPEMALYESTATPEQTPPSEYTDNTNTPSDATQPSMNIEAVPSSLAQETDQAATEPAKPDSEIIQTANGDELQINHQSNKSAYQ